MITADDPFLGRCTISRAAFEAAIMARNHNAGLDQERPLGEYWDESRAWGVDPNFLLAMFRHESSFGTAGTAATSLSWGNTRSHSFGAVPIGVVAGRSGMFPRFHSWIDGCASTTARLASPVWPPGAPYGERSSIREVFDLPSGGVWAPAGDMNDPDGYLNAVLASMNEWADQEEWIAAVCDPTPATYPAYLSVNFTPGRVGPDGDDHRPRAIILHITAGPSAQSCLNWFANPASEVSAHFVVDRDGTIYAAVDEDDTAWVNGMVEHPNRAIPIVDEWVSNGVNPNLDTIGIEVAGFSSMQPSHEYPDLNGYNEAQYRSLTYLLPELAGRHDIPLTREYLFGHNAISGTQRAACPGLSDDEWETLYRALADIDEGPYDTPDAAYDAWCAPVGDRVHWAGQITGKRHWCGRDPQEVARTDGQALLAYDGAYARDVTGFALDEWETTSQADGQLTIWRDPATSGDTVEATDASDDGGEPVE